jgi:hypothetical protein
MVPGVRAEVWDDLYSLLYHQGTVYSASFAALPALEAAARAWHPLQRLMPLVLAADIVNSTDVVGDRQALLAPHTEVVSSLRHLADECLETTGWERGDYVYLLRARLGLHFETLWGDVLEGLLDGEISARCPSCSGDLVLEMLHERWCVVEDVWPRPESSPRASVTAGAALAAPGPWLIEQSKRAGFETLADSTRGLFGRFSCPLCGADAAVPEAMERRWSN